MRLWRGFGDEAAARLEHVEGLELDGARAVLEQDHHELQVAHVAHVAHHDFDVRAVQQELAQQLRSQNRQRVTIVTSLRGAQQQLAQQLHAQQG